MGRSQAVRQRILIPPFGGSIPPAPANHSITSSLWPDRRKKPANRGLLRLTSNLQVTVRAGDAIVDGKSLASSRNIPLFDKAELETSSISTASSPRTCGQT